MCLQDTIIIMTEGIMTMAGTEVVLPAWQAIPDQKNVVFSTTKLAV